MILSLGFFDVAHQHVYTRRMQCRRPAFTLIELLIVIAIIGILATLVIVQTGDSNRKARNASAQSDIAQMGKAVESFRIDDQASGQVISDLPGSTDQQGGGQNTLASVFTGTQNIGTLTYAAAVTKTPGPPYIYRYVASGTPTVASGATVRQLVKGSPGLPIYSLCTTLVGAATPYFCASDAVGGGQSSLDQVSASQGIGNISAAAANGLVGWYKLDGTGTLGAATDASGNGNDGTLANFTFDGATNGWVPGKFGNALQFNGSNDYVKSASVSVGSSGTLSAWVYVTATTNYPMFISFGYALELRLLGGSNRPDLNVNSTDAVSPTAISPNQWHLITGSYSGTTATIYVDGISQNTATVPALGTASGIDLGARYPSNDYDLTGRLDDVRIYNRALGSTEVQQLYQGTF